MLTRKTTRRLATRCAMAALFPLVLSAAAEEKKPAAKDTEWPFEVPKEEIKHYTALRTSEKIVVDGNLSEKSWALAPRSRRFVDCLTGERAMYDTRVAVLWDDENLYVGYWVEEPNVRATLTQRDAPIYENNDVELFIAGKDAYYEFEINSFGTIYEVFFIWQEAYDKCDYASDPALEKSKLGGFNGVGFTRHPRGLRWLSRHWDFPGAQTAVQVQGTINDDSDKDKGWTVELAFPWKGMKWLAEADKRSLPPKDGDVWRLDFSRFNQYGAPAPAKDSRGWFLSRHGVWDSHIPELFPYVHFSAKDVAAENAEDKETGKEGK